MSMIPRDARPTGPVRSAQTYTPSAHSGCRAIPQRDSALHALGLPLLDTGPLARKGQHVDLVEIVTIAVAILGQAAGLWKIIDGRFAKLESALESKVSERRVEIAAAKDDARARHDDISVELSRVDKDVTHLGARVDSLPTAAQIEALLDKRVDRLERQIDRLTNAVLRPVNRGDEGG